MIESKIVTIENGEIINVGKLDLPKDENGIEIVPDGITFEERKMEYTKEYGWREVGWKPPLSEIDKLKVSQAEQFETLLMLMGGL